MQSIGQLSELARESMLVHDMERAEAEARYQAGRNGVDVAATMPVVALIMVSEGGGRLHSVCGFKSPIDYEHSYQASLTEELAP